MDRYQHRIDFDYVHEDALMPVARLWGVATGHKRDMRTGILMALNDSARVQRLIASLSAYDQTALALVRFAGDTCDVEALSAALRIVGFVDHATAGAINPRLVELVQCGILIRDSFYDPLRISTSYGSCDVCADDRILMHIDGALTCVPFALPPCPAPPAPIIRHPASITIDLLTIYQFIVTAQGIKPTVKGTIRVADLRRLSQLLGWPADGPVIAGMPFHEAVQLLITLLQAIGVLKQAHDMIVPGPNAETFFHQPYEAQIRTLLQAWLVTPHWLEWPDPHWQRQGRDCQVPWRFLLAAALMALPSGDAFVAFDDIAQTIFERVDSTYAIDGPVYPPAATYWNPVQHKHHTTVHWRDQFYATWWNRERRWLGRAVCTWLTYLGLVEVAVIDTVPHALRLSPLGRVLFQPWITPPEKRTAPVHPAWIVQPNFEVLVYLDRIPGDLLLLLAQHAERVHVDAHVARYRLTHDSVYQGLERGSTIDILIDGLERGAQTELPQNVRATLVGWAQQREQVVVYRSAQLLEFRDAKARQKALKDGLHGTEVGERFVLLARGTLIRGKPRIDYLKPQTHCLTATEAGALALTKPADLFLTAVLDTWAARSADRTTWQLSAERVQQACAAGRQIEDLLTCLRDRLTHPLPALLEVALRAWAGQQPPHTLESIVVFRCQQPAIIRAIAGSDMFRPYIREVLGSTAIALDESHVDAFRERLAWAGLDVFV